MPFVFARMYTEVNNRNLFLACLAGLTLELRTRAQCPCPSNIAQMSMNVDAGSKVEQVG